MTNNFSNQTEEEGVTPLTVFDKINLSYCAMQRARGKAGGNDGTFEGEFASAALWKNHIIYHTTKVGGGCYKFQYPANHY